MQFSPKYLTKGMKVLVSLAFVVWLLHKVHWQEVERILLQADVSKLAWYVVFVLLGMTISAKKWQLIARFKGFHRSLVACFRVYLTGTFINNFLPGFIGGDAYRSYWLGKQRESYAKAISTVVFDRLSGLFAAAVLALLFSWLNTGVVSQSSLWSFMVVMMSIIVIGGIFWGVVWKTVSEMAVMQGIVGFFPHKLRVFLGEVQSYFCQKILVLAFSLSLLFNIVGIGIANWVLFVAFGVNIPWFNFFTVIFLVSIVSSIPVSINNIGIKEWAYYTFFAFIYINPETAIAVALTSRFVQMLLSFFALPDFLHRKKLIVE
jgi:uncharacterized protein (TIRG00374 family)